MNIKVKGILFIFDEMVKNKIISTKTAFEKLILLQKINNRLPQNEINKRLNLWEKNRKKEK